MTDDLDEFLDSVVHGCAIAAFCHQMAEERRWPPDIEATKQRFNRYYEEELAAKNPAKAAGIARYSTENPEANEDTVRERISA